MDELEVSQDELAQAAESAKAGLDSQDFNPEDPHPATEETIGDVPSDFWDEGDNKSDEDEEEEGEEDDKPAESEEDAEPSDEDASEDGHPKTITYKADGEDVEITLEEAQRRLAMADEKVVRKAFSERNALRKQNQKLKKEAEENAEYRETWDKLENIKNDRNQLWKAITGEDLDTFIQTEMERREVFNSATPEEQRAILAERKLQERDRLDTEERKRREEQLSKADERIFQAEKKELRGLMLEEAREYKFASDTPQVSNKLNKMLWVNAVHDLEGYYTKYGKITKKMVKKAFTDNAAAIKHLYNVEAPAASAAETTRKKEVAKEKAEEAATRNYTKEDVSKFANLKPDELFQKFFRK